VYGKWIMTLSCVPQNADSFFLSVQHPDNCLEHFCIFICHFQLSSKKKMLMYKNYWKGIPPPPLPFAPLPARLHLWTQAHPFVVKVRRTLCLEIYSDDHQFRIGFPTFSTCLLCVLMLYIMASVSCKISTHF